MTNQSKRPTLGVIVGNRGFFPDHLCDSGRKTILQVLEEEGIQAVALTPEDTRYGSIESLEEAHKCAELFKQHRADIDGVVITLPNFGDERAISNALRWANLDVPVLVQATPDDPNTMAITDRRDSFCGKMSTCNNMLQHGIKFTLTSRHTMDPTSQEFREDLRRFVSTCRVVKGMKTARVGAIGARPAAFNTVRFSEKLLERSGITVETIDLSEIFGRAARMKADDPLLKARVDAIRNYVPTAKTPEESLTRMARLAVVIEQWMAENELQASAIQCWTAMQEFYGVVPCTLMSIMSNSLMPSACETDIAGVVGMYALMLASGKPSALVDWNNNFSTDPDKAVIFHCSNLPKDLLVDAKADPQAAVMDYQAIIAGTVGKDNTYGTVVGRMKPGALSFCRVSTDDFQGRISVYLAEGEVTADSLTTFGGYGVVRIPAMQTLLRYICENGFEHHVAVNPSRSSAALNEAFSKYLGWHVYNHAAPAV